MAEQVRSDQIVDEEIMRARLEEPEIKARITEIRARIARGDYGTPLQGEDLREFLRERLEPNLDDR